MGTTIYKVMLNVFDIRKPKTVDVDRKEVIIVDNLSTATAVFEDYKSIAECWIQEGKYSARVTITIPYVDSNGVLAKCGEEIKVFEGGL